MPEPRTPPTTAQARLAQALLAQDNLSHEEAEALMPALIDAEFAGEDVDQQPRFVPLLRHLDQCVRVSSCTSNLPMISRPLLVRKRNYPQPQQLARSTSLHLSLWATICCSR